MNYNDLKPGDTIVDNEDIWTCVRMRTVDNTKSAYNLWITFLEHSTGKLVEINFIPAKQINYRVFEM